MHLHFQACLKLQIHELLLILPRIGRHSVILEWKREKKKSGADVTREWAQSEAHTTPIKFKEMQKKGREREDGTVIVGSSSLDYKGRIPS